jgi:AraC-like DNA-binding protein
MTNIDVRIPADERARAVAQSLFGNPADGRTLADWGRDVGASERTLARAFLADTGLSFGQWRGLLRVRAATVALATGEPVARVARQVGYESTSAFVAAFRRATGTTPAAYFAHPAEGPG